MPERHADFLKSRGIYSLHALQHEDGDRWQKACDRIWDVQRTETCRVAAALLESGIRILWLKGSELVWRFFDGHALDVGKDSDLLIPREAVGEAKAVMHACGYRQARFDPESGSLAARDVADVAAMEASHYELAPFMRVIELEPDEALTDLARSRRDGPLYSVGNALALVIEIDIHHNVAIDIDVSGFFSRASRSISGQGETLSAADHLWLNLSRYYNEVGMHGAQALRPVAYTLPLLKRETIDWSVIVRAAEDLALGPTLSYPLGLCSRLAPGLVPDEVLKAVAGSSSSRLRDWGWQLAKPFGFEEQFPSYAFER